MADMKTTFVAALALALTTGCGLDRAQPPASQEALQRALIVGSAESPDPVLAKVRELEKTGAVRDVVVQESFPVQIRLRASKQVIDELEAMPRSGGLR